MSICPDLPSTDQELIKRSSRPVCRLDRIAHHAPFHSTQNPMKASSAYTVEQLRNPEFTKKFGVEASIMDYGRFNYVAQPGDGARLIPIIGPYDDFAVEWGYCSARSTAS